MSVEYFVQDGYEWLTPTPNAPRASYNYFKLAMENGFYGVIDHGEGPMVGYAFRDLTGKPYVRGAR